MEVYLVMSLIDSEYGNRVVWAVCSSREKAEQIIEREGQSTIETWYGSEKQFVIEEYEIDPE